MRVSDEELAWLDSEAVDWIPHCYGAKDHVKFFTQVRDLIIDLRDARAVIHGMGLNLRADQKDLVEAARMYVEEHNELIDTYSKLVDEKYSIATRLAELKKKARVVLSCFGDLRGWHTGDGEPVDNVIDELRQLLEKGVRP